jgi:hypothetical protein
MRDHGPIFQVTVDAQGVFLEKVKRKHPGYGSARKRAILRQRDAIELFRKRKGARKGFNGTYFFHFLDTARSFAILRLQAQQGELEENLNRVLAYAGGRKRSDE